MAKCSKGDVFAVVSVLSIFCIIAYAIAIAFYVMSLNPWVTWNIYHDDYFGLKIYFSHTLWTYLDKGLIEGVKTNGANTYIAILNEYQPEKVNGFKKPVIDMLHKAIGLEGGAVLLLLIAITVQTATKQKLFVTITLFLSVGTGIAGGYFAMKAIRTYQIGIQESLSQTGSLMFIQEKVQMTLGYDLAYYGSIIAFSSSALLLVISLLYIPFGDGKWIWKRKLVVTPETTASGETKKNESTKKKTSVENIKTIKVNTNVA